MNRRSLVCCAVLALGGLGARPNEGAPALTGVALDGAPVRLEALRGRVVVVDFFASWCEPCRASLPALQRLAEREAPRGVAVLGVCVDEARGSCETFARALGLRFPVVHDAGQGLAERWAPEAMPSTFVLRRDGVVAASFAGAPSEEALAGAVAALTAGAR